jgi:hypothetical protein
MDGGSKITMANSIVKRVYSKNGRLNGIKKIYSFTLPKYTSISNKK